MFMEVMRINEFLTTWSCIFFMGKMKNVTVKNYVLGKYLKKCFKQAAS